MKIDSLVGENILIFKWICTTKMNGFKMSVKNKHSVSNPEKDFHYQLFVFLITMFDIVGDATFKILLNVIFVVIIGL